MKNNSLRLSLCLWGAAGALAAACLWGSETLTAVGLILCLLAAIACLLYRIVRSRYRPLTPSEREVLAGSGADWLGLAAVELLLSCLGISALIIMAGGLGAALMLIPVWAYGYHRWRTRRLPENPQSTRKDTP